MPTRPQKVTYSYEAHTDCLKMATKPKCVYVYISNLIGFPNIQELPFKNSEQRRKCDNRGKTRHLFNSCVYSLQRPINMWIFFCVFLFALGFHKTFRFVVAVDGGVGMARGAHIIV